MHLKLNKNGMISKLNIGMKYLQQGALQIDAKLHHWSSTYKLHPNNSMYTQPIGYIFQYNLISINKATKYYIISFKINENQSHIYYQHKMIKSKVILTYD